MSWNNLSEKIFVIDYKFFKKKSNTLILILILILSTKFYYFYTCQEIESIDNN